MKISIVIPALNEEAGIADVIKQVPVKELAKMGYSTEIIVSDNGSTDRTAEIATKHGARVIYQPIRGYGNAYKAGFANATGDIIATGDADMTYPFDALPGILKKMEKEGWDFINTDRLSTLNPEAMKPSHVIGNWGLSTVTKTLFGWPFRDSQSGMWIFKRSILEKMDVRAGGMPFSQELKIEAYIRGFKCTELPIEYRVRAGDVKLNAIRDGLDNISELFKKRFTYFIRPSKIAPKKWSTLSPAQRQPKNILIVSHYYPPHIGGIEFVAYNQAKRLVAQGHNVTVVTSSTGPDEKSGVIDGVNIIRIPAFNGFQKWGVPFPIFAPSIVSKLSKAIKATDVVHIHDAFYMSSFVAAMIARWQNKAVALTQHVAMVDHQSGFVMAVQKLVYATTGAVVFRASDTIITLNDRVEKFLIEHGVSKGKIVALNNGVDADLFFPATQARKKELRKEFGLSPNKKVLLFVGRFVHKKGFDALFAARDSKYQIVFAGGEKPSHVGDDVVFFGKLEQSRLAQLYRAADVFILPSHGEGFPLSVQEAMACGLPIITTDDHGYGRYNFDKHLICLIENPNEKSLRAAIESILADSQRLKEMSLYSQKYAKAHFGWQLIVSQLDGIYEKILKEKP